MGWATVIAIVGRASVVLLAGAVALVIVDWLRAARLYGGTYRAAFHQMLRAVWRSQSWWLLVLVVVQTVGTLSLLSDPLFRQLEDAAAVAIGLLSVALSTFLVRLRPPAVLFLASSRAAGYRLFQTLRSRVGPYRVVALLDPPRGSPIGSAHQLDSMRTARATDWMRQVEVLMDIVPVTVLDTRTVTPPVLDEVRLLAEAHARRRVVLVSQDDGELPAVVSAGANLAAPQPLIATEDTCPAVVQDLLRSLGAASIATPRPTVGSAEGARPSSPATPLPAVSRGKARAVIRIAGFLIGHIGPVRCIRAGSALRLKGLVGIRGYGEDFMVIVEGPRDAIEKFIDDLVHSCPGSVGMAKRMGLAGGISVEWAEATGQFDALPDDLPFTQISLDSPQGSR